MNKNLVNSIYCIGHIGMALCPSLITYILLNNKINKLNEKINKLNDHNENKDLDIIE